MTEGTLVEWLQPDGAEVDEGDPIYLLETDKVENEIPAPASGCLHHQSDAGATVPVGAQVGEIT